jgi:hypothetical protein
MIRLERLSLSGRWLLPLAAILAASCYRYTPTTAATPAIGSFVRLALRDPSPELMRVLGAETVAVEGQVVGTSDIAYTVAVTATLKPPTVSTAMRRTVWASEHVMIPVTAVGSTELRSLNRGATARVVAVSTVAVAVAVRLIMTASGSSGGSDNGGGGPPPP